MVKGKEKKIVNSIPVIGNRSKNKQTKNHWNRKHICAALKNTQVGPPRLP